MELTQQDFEDRLAKVDDGTADDEDHRLVKHYRREGYRVGDEPADGSWLAAQQDNGGDGEPEYTDGYTAMRYKELQALARQRNLNAGGSEQELIGRLREDDQKRRDAAAQA